MLVKLSDFADLVLQAKNFLFGTVFPPLFAFDDRQEWRNNIPLLINVSQLRQKLDLYAVNEPRP